MIIGGKSLVVSFVSILCLSLVACAGDDDDDKQPSSSTSSTTPAADGGAKGSGETASTGLGPQCEAYVACCKEVASAQPALASSCKTAQDQLAKAKEQGATSAQTEDACKSYIATMKTAGYCK
jgi:hypothetical protein